MSKTAWEQLQDLHNRCEWEECDLLDSLPSIQAIIDLWAMVDSYGVDFVAGVAEGIEEGEYDPAAYDAFIAKYDLDWNTSTAIRANAA